VQPGVERRHRPVELARRVSEQLDQPIVPAQRAGGQVPVERADARGGDRQVQQRAPGLRGVIGNVGQRLGAASAVGAHPVPSSATQVIAPDGAGHPIVDDPLRRHRATVGQSPPGPADRGGRDGHRRRHDRPSAHRRASIKDVGAAERCQRHVTDLGGDG
jgi:hypothetical protein